MNNFALLDIKLKREFRFILKPLATEVQVCASDTRKEIGCECGHAFTLKREARITASSPVKRKKP